MKITFLGPRGAIDRKTKTPYSFPKLKVSGLIPGDDYDVPGPAGRALINAGLAEQVYDEAPLSEVPEASEKKASRLTDWLSGGSEESTSSDESGSDATEAEE